MKALFVILLLFLPSFSQAEQLVRITAEDVIERLRRNGTFVCFERVHNQKEDAITLKAQIQSIEKIPVSQRTPREKERLGWGIKSQKEGISDETIVSWKQKEFDFDYPDVASDPKDILESLIHADSDYAWEQQGKRYLVYPRQKSFNRPIQSFAAENLKFWDFIKAAQDQILTPSGLNHIFAGVGRPWTMDYQDKTFTLTLASTDSRTALTDFCDAIDQNIVWSVIGCEPDWMNVSFFPIIVKK